MIFLRAANGDKAPPVFQFFSLRSATMRLKKLKNRDTFSPFSPFAKDHEQALSNG